MKFGFCVVLSTLSMFCFASLTPAADDLEKQFVKHAPEVLEKLKERGYKNVGVLKFRVKKGTEPATDRAGTLNLRLAEKLEMALILGNKVKDPVGIVRDANRVAATIPGANHLTREGRTKFFEKDYPLAWGTERVVPDAFLTGVAFLEPDFKTMTVGLATFDQAGTELQQIIKFSTALDLEDLLESGESFTLRGAFDQGNLQLTDEERKDKASEEAVQVSLEVKKETAKDSKPVASKTHPLSPSNPDAPVMLEIRYDGKPQAIEFREGAAFVPEPDENQKVVLIVRRKGAGRPRLGVVVKVNGENTLYRQKQADPQCSAWVFEPNLTEFGIQGYHIDHQTMEEFRVLSKTESQAREIDYGEFVGTISVSVFQEQKTEPKPSLDLLSDEGEDFAVLTRSVFPKETPKNLSALKNQLAHSATRGLIAQGARIEAALKATEFKTDPIPVMTATIKYYNPQDLPE